jgi:hypothetical protein
MKLQNTLLTNLNDPTSMLLSRMSVLQMLLEGNIGGIPMTEGMLLFAGICLEIPFLMVVLSAILPHKANRITTMAAATLMIIIQSGSFFFGSDVTLHYLFFSVVEILGNMTIFVLAFRWKKTS